MWWIIDLLLDIAVEWCSWRLWLSIAIAISILAGIYFAYPGQTCMWYVSVPAACCVVVFGVAWQIRADRS